MDATFLLDWCSQVSNESLDTLLVLVRDVRRPFSLGGSRGSDNSEAIACLSMREMLIDKYPRRLKDSTGVVRQVNPHRQSIR